MSARHPELVVDNIRDLSAGEDSVLLLGSLPSQMDQFLEVRVLDGANAAG